MLYNWPWTLSVTLMLPWTPYSSFDVQEKKGGGRSTEWTSENASVKPQQCFHESPVVLGPHFWNHCFTGI
ncbi:hypothetical protein T05_2769, partial [Trichinella murrelli]